jgi:hypothetical protein
MMSEREFKAAYAFAQSKPTEWEAFKAQWNKSNPEPVVEPVVFSEPEAVPTVEEEAPKSRKKKVAVDE